MERQLIPDDTFDKAWEKMYSRPMVAEQPLQKYGHWTQLFGSTYVCSCCNQQNDWCGNTNPFLKGFLFCPKCGAKMTLL